MASGGTSPERQLLSGPETNSLVRPKKRVLWLALLLAIATVFVYYPIHNCPFLNYDDNVYVTENLYVKSGLQLDTVRWAFTTYDASNWHPITWLSHAFDYQLFQLNPSGHHETNLLLHLGNVLLLLWLLWQATGCAGRSLMVAALFALHPINVESVAWVSERKNLLSMLFFLLALGAYRWYVREPRFDRYAAVAILSALGLMAKPQVITLPFVLLLWDYWPLRRMFTGPAEVSTPAQVAIPPRSFLWLLKEKIPLFGLSAASAFITIRAQRAGRAVAPLMRLPLSVRLSNAIVSYVRYIGKAFYPTHLSPMYPHPWHSLMRWQVFAALLLLVSVTGLVAANWQRRPYLPVGWFWFLGTLVPMIGLVQVGNQGSADRYAYLPFVGLFIMICWGVAELAEQWHIPVAWEAGLSVVALLVLAAITQKQISYWSSNLSLWSHAVQVTSNNWVAEDNLGGALLDQGRMEDAMPHFFRAVAIFHGDSISNLNIGAYEQQHGNLLGALERYKKVVGLTRDPVIKAKAYWNMGSVYRDLGDPVLSRKCFQAAESLSP